MSRTSVSRFGRYCRTAVAVVGASAILAGCASSNDGAGDNAAEVPAGFQTGMVNVQPAPGQAVDGGTLTYGVQLLAASLDPTKTAARGGSGGEALAAVYDVLMSYDTDTNTYEPKLAKSLAANADSTVWTLTLRDNVNFSDGTPVDAAAVVASIDRYNQGRGNGSDLWLKSVAAAEPAADGASVVFTMTAPWQRFPSMLALGHGMIVAPASQQGEAFTAIGAGPFTEGKFAPNEERIFTANPDYYAGKPHLDTLRMVALNGPQANLESLQSGQLDVAYIRGLSEAIDAAKADGYPGYISVLNAGGAEIINNREGRPGSDVRVRQAIGHSLDTELIDQRAENGGGLPGSELFGPTSQWHTDTPGIAYDPEKAKELLAAAVADGYNGELNYVVLNEPKDHAIGLAVQSLLQAVGFKVNVVLANNAGDILQNVYVKKDFDLAHAGLGMYESIIDLSLDSTTNSTSLGNTGGYANPEMDQLIADLQATQDDDAARAVIAKIQALWNETVPSAPISGLPSFWAWQKNVHGVTPTATGIMLFDQAWLDAN
ncbi:ABC transporter substrate-binding protein [Tomitella biformata]|uniref:ABC transporter substrate-binding protein n=1 Tax=Tomitella biformata TaxID=630403 RepID=UPI000465F93B|nr:ABC transporter substrate-binding protein [Tomitella biformata]